MKARTGIRHGTTSTYSNHGCRCDLCRQAKSRANKRHYENSLNRDRPVPADQHGTINGYQHHSCRCDPCRTAHRDYQAGVRRRSRQRRISTAVEAAEAASCPQCAAAVAKAVTDALTREGRAD